MRGRVAITGGTGYMGRRLIPLLIGAGCDVHAVVRPGSERKLPARATAILADVLDASSYRARLRHGDTFV
ncbi:MAG TPA: epimerase, partial [Acidimicrobiaceae bacterium]|nr:epimerase [Acidimicrobiaceae bacterium]